MWSNQLLKCCSTENWTSWPHFICFIHYIILNYILWIWQMWIWFGLCILHYHIYVNGVTTTKSQTHITILCQTYNLLHIQPEKDSTNSMKPIWFVWNFCHIFCSSSFVCYSPRNRLVHCMDSNSKSHPHSSNAKPTQTYTRDYRFLAHWTPNTAYSYLRLCVPKSFRLMFAQ